MTASRLSIDLILLASAAFLLTAPSGRMSNERLSFQTSVPWSPRTSLNANGAMVYGIGPRMPANIETWRGHEYIVQVMAGVAWQYQDYLDGQFDGEKYWDQARTQSGWQAHSAGPQRAVHVARRVKRDLIAGAQAIYLEETEFRARGGWGQASHSSPDAQYRASRLKYYLYRRALSRVSLVSYAHWRIMSPESSLIAVGANGYIAQVWTGRVRTPDAYEGPRQERTFESAFLEYGAAQNLVLPPEVWRYAIMPWPGRIVNGHHPARSNAPDERVAIPKPYETELQAVISALGAMKQPGIRWQNGGTRVCILSVGKKTHAR